jgi:hypothetical protein
MEDVLEVYQRPHDPEYPLVCLDETSKQLIVDSNEGGHLLQSDRGHHSNLMAASRHRLVGRFW